MDILNSLALFMLFFISITGVYVVIYIHDIPYEIAKKRNHPHQDAIHIAGWVSLFLMHTIWPFLWIWAHLFKEDQPALISVKGDLEKVGEIKEELKKVTEELESLKSQVSELTSNK